jgi:hypothetical protein
MIGGSAGTVITGALIMGALAYKAIDLVKYLVALLRLKLGHERHETSDDHKSAVSSALNGLVTLLLGCGAGIGVVFLMANTTWSDEIQLGNQTLKTLPSTSLIVLGLAITSLAAVLFDAKKAVDGTDSASTPKLMPTADKNRRERVHAKLPADADVAARIEANIEREVERMLEAFRRDGAAETTPPPREKI